MREDISIRTKDGDCRSYVFTPSGGGAHPAILFYMDGLAIRPTLFDMGERLAQSGYVVLMPDMFYRAGPYEPFDIPALMANGGIREVLGKYFAFIDNKRASEDTESFLAYLDARKDVAGSKIVTTGYCMGGGMSLTAAGTFPDRVVAAASFHGGNLASDSPMSPHLLAPKMKGEIYVAGAVEDGSYPPEMNTRLDEALSAAKVAHRCEFYEGAKHGWTMRDTPIYNETQAERHWRELTALAQRALN